MTVLNFQLKYLQQCFIISEETYVDLRSVRVSCCLRPREWSRSPSKLFWLLNISIIMSLSGPCRCLTSCCRTDWWETRVLTLLFWTHSLAKFCWLPARRAWYQVRSGREYKSDFVNRIYSGTVLWEELFAISPVVVGISSTSRVDTEWDQCGGVEEGDDTWKILF